ncbi:hypothetical protein P175DRAFT_0497301 [Aspergillus ochraceoroseus IBT 24754]|uniref:Uncharacterized protein n=2 Tax=Aspergillus ochraceoroseus TaxID=138278 RepID=A0A2T5M6N9_9EURO|nr:uncharacterized protein P175DRAFT_0497301 [Aspergillus ochraceoroseus IBT 24754]KKK19674.1 hypothetical protein AOCH_000833 [Aspergillus ochraceoroseus]PTU24189.1 hypothetical protein P175DRAFT_0497301 [Aspergillus ochraceoroseus IBT 24754]
MKNLCVGIPLAVLASVATAQVIGGPGGVDVGNDASIPTSNSFTSSVTDDWVDDHSFEVKHDVHVYPPHEHAEGAGCETCGHKKRGEPWAATVIGGPGGIDTGNDATIPVTNDFSSSVTDDYTDDHSVDIDETFAIGGWPHEHGFRPGMPGFERRSKGQFAEGPGEATVIGGPSGVDVGNGADIPTDNSFTSSVTDTYTDDHSVDINDKTTIWAPEHPAHGYHHPMHIARHSGKGPTVIGGPSAVDVGNSADIPTTNSFSSSVDDTYTDDHSFSWESDFVAGRPHLRRALRQGPTVIGGSSGFDSGNTAVIPSTNSFDSETTSTHNDNHAVKINTEEYIKGGYEAEPHVIPHPHYNPVPGPQPPAPEQPVPYAEPKPSCTEVTGVVETVTSTAYTTETVPVHAPHPEPAQPQTGNPEPEYPAQPSFEPHPGSEPSDPQPEQEPAPTHAETESEPEPTYPTPESSEPEGQSENSHPAPEAPQQELAPEPESAGSEPQFPAPENEDEDGSMSPVPVYPDADAQHGSLASPAPAATPVEMPAYHPSGAATEPTSVLVVFAPMSSSMPSAQVSSYSVIPVYVPTASRTPIAPGAYDMDASTPSDSASFVARPSGASAEEFNGPSEPSPSSHSTLFTGSAANIAPGAGIISIFCGVFGLLAFVL